MKLVSLFLLAVACVMLQFVAPEKIANRSCKFCRDAEFDNDEDADNDQERDSRELGDVSDLGEKFVILLSDNIISHFSDSEKSRLGDPPKNVCSMDKLVPKFVRCYANEVARKKWYDNPDTHDAFNVSLAKSDANSLADFISEKNHIAANRQVLVAVMNCFLSVALNLK
uniref:Uncharacterized protein n=1 Tax=Cacopsylla melanoneura TaxID=428564 RepID=A0A8D8ZCW1_9HEMI